jgi:hypothetical protein
MLEELKKWVCDANLQLVAEGLVIQPGAMPARLTVSMTSSSSNPPAWLTMT